MAAAAAAAADVSSSPFPSSDLCPPPLPEGDGQDAPNWVLLDILGYMGDHHRNANFAQSKTSTGEQIQVSFHTARPPQVSHFCVHCPDLGPDGFVVPPKVISANSDLILFQVSVCPQVRFNPRYCDYFLYRAHPRKPSLYLLPHPYPKRFKDKEVALLSFSDDGGFAVAALTRNYQKLTPNKEFNLYLYRSSKAQEGWTSKVVSVTERRRDKVLPVDCAPYHETSKVIVLGRGALGMVGWVDLWRGILVCNVLEEDPALLDIPLPLPADGNRRLYRKCSPHIMRDITVNLLKDSIKYIEVENPKKNVVSPDNPLDSSVRQKQPPSRAWKATAWSRPIPIDPSKDWDPDYTYNVAGINIDPLHCEQLPRLRGTEDNPSKATLPAQLIGFPTISMDDDVLYLLCMAYHTGQKIVVISIDMRKNALQGFANLVRGKDFTFMRNCTSEISKYLSKDEGTREASETSLLQEKTSLLLDEVKYPNILVKMKAREKLWKQLQEFNQ